MFAALGVRDFRNLWFGTFAGHLGFWVYVTAQSWLAWELTQSATFLGVTNVAAALPGLVLMLPGGVIADRWNRRKMLLYSNVFQLLGGMVTVSLIAADSIEPWQLLALMTVIAAAAAINLPARQSLGPEVAGPSLVANTVALNAISFNLSRVLGPMIAGLLIAAGGNTGSFVVAAVLFVLAVVLTLLLRPDTSRAGVAPQRSVIGNFTEGLRFVRDERTVRASTIVCVIENALGMAYVPLMPALAADVFRVGGGGLGLLMAGLGFGSLLGAIGSASIHRMQMKGRVVIVSGAIYGAAIVAFAATGSLVIAMVTLVVLGVSQALSLITGQTILNLATPNELRGRTMSVYMMSWSIAPLSALPAGWAADTVGAMTT
ncbi:MAG: major facilitator superfamily 1, partial [Chloroflexi bacterium]|nr:major facilitator superfamily 1 [Chloroflexota bacterium]